MYLKTKQYPFPLQHKAWDYFHRGWNRGSLDWGKHRSIRKVAGLHEQSHNEYWQHGAHLPNFFPFTFHYTGSQACAPHTGEQESLPREISRKKYLNIWHKGLLNRKKNETENPRKISIVHVLYLPVQVSYQLFSTPILNMSGQPRLRDI